MKFLWQVLFVRARFLSWLCSNRTREVSPISVELRPGESQDSILKRFRKAVAEARILPIVRQKRWFTSKSEIKRIKRQKAIRKSQRHARVAPSVERTMDSFLVQRYLYRYVVYGHADLINSPETRPWYPVRHGFARDLRLLPERTVHNHQSP